MVCFECLSLTVFVSQNGYTALHMAALKGHLPMMELLLERAPQLFEVQSNVSTAWFVARELLSLTGFRVSEW